MLHPRRPRSFAVAALNFGAVFIFVLSACQLNLASTPIAPDGPTSQHDAQSAPDRIDPVKPELSGDNPFPNSYIANIPALVDTVSVAHRDGSTENLYITDAVFDPVTNQIYISDNLGQMTIVDAATYQVLHTFEAWGYLYLDADNRRLYIAPDEFPLPLELIDEPVITIFDLGAARGDLPTFVDAIRGMSLAVDAENRRIFVGEPLAFGEDGSAQQGVRIYDSLTLNLLGQSEQSGRPIYNPFRDELLIVAYTVYMADAATGAVNGMLPVLPPDEEPLLWCSGCTWATQAHILEDRAQIGVLAHPQGSRQYASYPLVAFDANTLELQPDPILREDRGPDCGNPLRMHLPTRVGDAFVHHAFEANYIVENFLEIYARGETSPTKRIAGIAPLYVDAEAAQVTTIDGLLIDLETFSPITTTDPLCIFGELPGGLRFGRPLPPWDGGDELHIIEWREARIDRPEPILSAGLMGYEVAEIIVPAHADDAAYSEQIETIFVRTEYEDGLFRSQDGGETWALLDAGVPWYLFEGMSVQLSPDYRNDQTLFVAGPNVSHRGLGVWISINAGETWHPRWDGLDDLRIASLLIAPDFSLETQEQSLIAQSVAGKIYRTMDAGAHWVLLADAEQAGAFDSLAQFLSDEPSGEASSSHSLSEPLVRIDVITGDLIHRIGQGESAEWGKVEIDLPPLPNGSPQHWTQVIAAPDDPYVAFALSERTIWRTLDGGINWLPMEMPELSTLPEDAYLRTATLSGNPYIGGTTLLVGTSHGEVWILRP